MDLLQQYQKSHGENENPSRSAQGDAISSSEYGFVIQLVLKIGFAQADMKRIKIMLAVFAILLLGGSVFFFLRSVDPRPAPTAHDLKLTPPSR